MTENSNIEHETKEEALEFLRKTAEQLNEFVENTDLETIQEKPLPEEGDYSVNAVYEQIEIETAFKCLYIAVSRFNKLIENFERNEKTERLAKIIFVHDYYHLTAKVRDFSWKYGRLYKKDLLPLLSKQVMNILQSHIH